MYSQMIQQSISLKTCLQFGSIVVALCSTLTHCTFETHAPVKDWTEESSKLEYESVSVPGTMPPAMAKILAENAAKAAAYGTQDLDNTKGSASSQPTSAPTATANKLGLTRLNQTVSTEDVERIWAQVSPHVQAKSEPVVESYKVWLRHQLLNRKLILGSVKAKTLELPQFKPSSLASSSELEQIKAMPWLSSTLLGQKGYIDPVWLQGEHQMAGSYWNHTPSFNASEPKLIAQNRAEWLEEARQNFGKSL
jgi:hypothetical protein